MKRYKKYMDGIKASDTLRRRLSELEAPVKRPVPWKRYGAVAAALVLVCGLGGFGAWAAHLNGLEPPVPFYPPGFQEVAVVDPADPEAAVVPDIAPADPGDVTEPGERVYGGYDIVYGGLISHYVLPYIEYGDMGDAGMDDVLADWDIPTGATQRDLQWEEILTLMGGEDTVYDHFAWKDYALTGWAAWYEDGSLWGAYVNGVDTAYGWDSFEFAVTADQLPPTCYGYPNSMPQEIRGLTVTASKFDWPLGYESITHLPLRQVCFMKGNYGYRFEMKSTDADLAEELVSRLVRQVADCGIDLASLGGVNDASYGGAMDVCYPEDSGTYTCPECGQTIPVGGLRVHVHAFAGENGAAMTRPYDPATDVNAPQDWPRDYGPGETMDPYYNAPSVSANPEDYICTGVPVPPTPEPAESGEICGLPLYDPDGVEAAETIYCD